MDKHYRLGMRAVKTCIATFLCLAIGYLAERETTMIIGTVAAIICLKPTKEETLHADFMRLLSTLVGGVIGFLPSVIGEFFPIYAEGLFILIVPVFILLDIYICNLLRIQEATALSCVVVLLIATHIDLRIEENLLYAINRILDTFIGATVATLVNIAIPWKPEQGSAPPEDRSDQSK